MVDLTSSSMTIQKASYVEITKLSTLIRVIARRISQYGFMVLTGAGGGIMQAGNEGAGRENSFGLNIQLPFEQGANPHIINDAKLIDFKYFFTRKLFFLRESDAVALFPGGFGTQDEAFETLTLCQTGKYGPAPLVLIDEPDGDYWQTWQEQISENLQKRGLISAEDRNFYTITNDLDYACQTIRHFYRVYHSSRFVGESFVIRLNHELSGEQIEQIREITNFLSRPPLESSRSVVVIEQADTMTESAANALLKTLEEPGKATLILIAPSPSSLLPTLVSRCQHIPLSLFPRELWTKEMIGQNCLALVYLAGLFLTSPPRTPQ